jgi:hypothetical protein
MRIIIEKDENLIEVAGNGPTPEIFEFADKWIESVLYLSTYQQLKGNFLIQSRDCFIITTEDIASLVIFQKLFFHEWEIDVKSSNMSGPTYVLGYVRREKR